MPNMVRDMVEVAECGSLDALIARLVEARTIVPDGATIRFTGDDVFGRRISISFLRPPTREEEEREMRYSEASEAELRRRITSLREEVVALERRLKAEPSSVVLAA